MVLQQPMQPPASAAGHAEQARAAVSALIGMPLAVPPPAWTFKQVLTCCTMICLQRLPWVTGC